MIKARERFEEVFQKEIPKEILDFIKDDMKKITADENIRCD
jgi:3-methyladenine DNA glycosylase Tag